MKIMITGGTGFIGRNLQEAWRGKYQLAVPSRKEMDLLDSKAVEHFLEEGHFDVVVHAANTNHIVHPEFAERMLDCNLRMFSNLQRCSGLYKKLIYFGSGAEYSAEHYIPQMKEDYLGRHVPNDPYGFSKYLMAVIAEQSQNIYDLCLFGVFGKYEEWSRRFLSNVIYQCMTKGEVHMDRHMYFDYLYIDDLIKILDWFLTNDPEFHRYNICTGRQYDLYDLARIIRDKIDRDATIALKGEEWKPPYTGDNTRLTEEMGKQSFTPVEKAIEEMIRYYEENGFA